jgi:prepilin-type N-terminal cleavage/methylation domain-containing protein
MLIKFKKLKLGQKGDTIIEVMISLAILSFVLGGAYYTANQSYRNIRDSQEHSEATNIAQTEIEDLRQYGPSFNGGTDQCLTDDAGSVQAQTTDCYVENTNQTYPGYVSASACNASTASYCYEITITGPTVVTLANIASMTSVKVHTYEVNVQWPPIGGKRGHNDQVTLFYRADDLL